MDLTGYLRRIQNKDATETFAQATDSLEAIRDFLTTFTGEGLCYYGLITAIPGANQFTVPELAGLGDAKFTGPFPYRVFVLRDAGGAGAAPQSEMQRVTAYVSATGTFTHAAFTVALTAGDEVLIIHPRIAEIFDLVGANIIASGTLDTSSATVPADSTRTEGNDYFNGCLLMTFTGAVAFQPRRIVDYTGVGGIFTLDPNNPFTAASGLVAYIVVSDQTEFVPGADAAINRTPADVIGDKTSTPVYTPTNTSDIIRYLKGLLNTLNMSSRPAINLYEGWQDEAGIDLTVWTLTNPATGVAWARAADGADLMASSIPNANETARLRSNQRWVAAPTLYGINKVLRCLILEFEFQLANVANLDNTLCFFGLTPAIGNDRSSNNIIGFSLLADVLQSVTDLAGVETTNTGFGETLTNKNKLRIEILLNTVRFYINETLVASHVTNLPDQPMYLNFFADTEAGGTATIKLGIVRAWLEDIAR